MKFSHRIVLHGVSVLVQLDINVDALANDLGARAIASKETAMRPMLLNDFCNIHLWYQLGWTKATRNSAVHEGFTNRNRLPIVDNKDVFGKFEEDHADDAELNAGLDKAIADCNTMTDEFADTSDRPHINPQSHLE